MAETLLPANATALETAVARVGAARRPLPADLVKAVWNPWACPDHMLPILANQMSVDVWDPAWDELKKRRVIAAAIHDQKRKGTLATLRAYAGYRDAEIVQVDRPPQRFFAGGSQTPAEREAWIAGLPQIRLYVQGSIIAARPRIIAGGGKPFFLRRRFAFPTSAPARSGERAVLWRNGVETPIGNGSWNGTSELTISDYGIRGPRLHAGRGVGAHASPSIAATHLYRILLEADGGLTPIAPGTRLQSTQVETTSDIMTGRRQWRGSGIAYRRYARPSTAETRVYRRIAIIDATVAAEPRKSMSFASLTRLAVPAHTADISLDIPGKGCRRGFVAGVRTPGTFAMRSMAAERIRPAFDAVAAAKRLTDTLFINTNVHRPLTAGSPLFAGTIYRAGQWTRS